MPRTRKPFPSLPHVRVRSGSRAVTGPANESEQRFWLIPRHAPILAGSISRTQLMEMILLGTLDVAEVVVLTEARIEVR